SARTVSLCTKSPRMASGAPVLWASVIASRTPKHMPRCSARMIFMRLLFSCTNGGGNQSTAKNKYACQQENPSQIGPVAIRYAAKPADESNQPNGNASDSVHLWIHNVD